MHTKIYLGCGGGGGGEGTPAPLCLLDLISKLIPDAINEREFMYAQTQTGNYVTANKQD